MFGQKIGSLEKQRSRVDDVGEVSSPSSPLAKPPYWRQPLKNFFITVL